VFGLIDRASCQPNQAGFAVIFEYRDQNTCTGLKNRANQFITLDKGNPAFPSPVYNAALQTITDTVTKANAMPTLANGSALNQARTNEVTFGLFGTGAPWELRQFDINGSSNELLPHSINQTPDVSVNGSKRLADCMNDTTVVQCGQASAGGNVPVDWEPSTPAGPFLTASIDYLATFFFNAPGVTPLNRWNFSGNTCGGCHGADRLNPNVVFGPGGLNIVAPAGPWPASFTFNPESFYQVDPRTPGGTPARLSRFVKGTNVLPPKTPIPDPAGSGMTMNFYDLLRRNSIMSTQSVNSCFVGPFVGGFIPQVQLAIVH
jgi:hypothetical protein